MYGTVCRSVWILLVVMAFVLVSSDPPLMLFGLFVLYGLSGYVFWGYQALRSYSTPPCAMANNRPAPR